MFKMLRKIKNFFIKAKGINENVYRNHIIDFIPSNRLVRLQYYCDNMDSDNSNYKIFVPWYNSLDEIISHKLSYDIKCAMVYDGNTNEVNIFGWIYTTKKVRYEKIRPSDYFKLSEEFMKNGYTYNLKKGELLFKHDKSY